MAFSQLFFVLVKKLSHNLRRLIHGLFVKSGARRQLSPSVGIESKKRELVSRETHAIINGLTHADADAETKCFEMKIDG